MVVEYIRYSVPPTRTSDFEAAYRRAQAHLRLAPECMGFELSRCEEAPASYILRITWTSTADHLQGFRKGTHFPPFLSEIRDYVEYIDEMRHYAPLDIRDTTSIYEAAGGLAAFERLAHDMHTRMVADDRLGDWFSRAAPEHVPHLAKWLAQVFGGPPLYTDELGDIALILQRHANLDIPEDKRARFEQIGAEAAAATWPDRPDVVQAVSRYVAWGSHIAVENAKPGHVADPGAGVPTWGWDDE